MNKLVKGSIAGAAGIALLLGGAGTFALWNDSQTVNGGNVQTGTLDIALSGSGAWADVSPDAADTTWVVATDRLVPGDTVTFTQSVTIVATGKNLEAELAYAAGSIVVAPALVPYIDITLTATKTSGDATIAPAAAPDTYTIVPVAGGSSVFEVVITVAFDPATSGQIGQTLATGVNLTAASFTLVQVRP